MLHRFGIPVCTTVMLALRVVFTVQNAYAAKGFPSAIQNAAAYIMKQKWAAGRTQAKPRMGGDGTSPNSLQVGQGGGDRITDSELKKGEAMDSRRRNRLQKSWHELGYHGEEVLQGNVKP